MLEKLFCWTTAKTEAVKWQNMNIYISLFGWNHSDLIYSSLAIFFFICVTIAFTYMMLNISQFLLPDFPNNTPLQNHDLF